MKKKLHILLIEDDPDDVELLETAFKDREEAAEFTVISQGDRVLPFLSDCEVLPDLLLLDLNLPKVHGREVLASIKSHDAYKSLPVIILTTSSAQSDIDYCLTTGADFYFTKPTKLAEFYKIVNTVVETALKN